MFGSKSPRQKLEAKYKKLLEESYRLSTSDRAKSDKKLAEANEIQKQLEQLERDGS